MSRRRVHDESIEMVFMFGIDTEPLHLVSACELSRQLSPPAHLHTCVYNTRLLHYVSAVSNSFGCCVSVCLCHSRRVSPAKRSQAFLFLWWADTREGHCWHCRLQIDGRLGGVHGSVLVPSFSPRCVCCILEDRLCCASCCMEMLDPGVCMTVPLSVNLTLGLWFFSALQVNVW